MTDPSFQLRAGQSGPRLTGTPGHVLTFDASGDTVSGQPGGGGGGGGRVFQNTAFVDQTFAGTSTGAFEEPYSSVQDALNAAPTNTMIIVAPAVYTEAPTVPAGKRLALQLLEYSGGPRATITGALTWNVDAGDELHVSGVDLPGGIVQHEAGSTNGAALLRLENLACQGISGALVHAVVALVMGANVKDGAALAGTATINGSVSAENTSISAAVTVPSFLASSCTLGNNITAPTIRLVGCGFQGLITVDCSGNCYMDGFTAFGARTGLNYTGAGVIHYAEGDSLQELPGVVGGAAPVFDWKIASSQRFTLDQNATATFGDPLYSQFLCIGLEQGGLEHFTFTWPGSVVNPPTIPATGNSEYLLFFNKETAQYYPLQLAPPVAPLPLKAFTFDTISDPQVVNPGELAFFVIPIPDNDGTDGGPIVATAYEAGGGVPGNNWCTAATQAPNAGNVSLWMLNTSDTPQTINHIQGSCVYQKGAA